MLKECKDCGEKDGEERLENQIRECDRPGCAKRLYIWDMQGLQDVLRVDILRHILEHARSVLRTPNTCLSASPGARY